MKELVGKVCPYCKTELKDGVSVKFCPACGTPHHEECWAENKGCSTFGCSEQQHESQVLNITDSCSKCGTPLGDGQAFCPKCGSSRNIRQLNKCGKCGVEMQSGQEFCTNCGQKAGLAVDSSVAAKIGQFNTVVENMKTPSKSIIAILAAVAVLVILIFTFKSEVNFKKVYSSIGGDEDYCTLAKDGSYLKIDTNPSDIEDDFSVIAMQMIKDANKELGFSENLIAKMGETRSLDGRQKEENDQVAVSWTYHPDNGLEVLYEKKK
ncbi:zinc-ribbon domain-containing protein [Bacillus sp. T3]|uniref:zinc-ribbon domain-containing protein n=1 Tax=Bacillus sp. T3 TaxID=467262 RepID=UPI00298182EC|nr:zinc-ribbon domain-containing protein [Bacillus sp. T3]